MEATTEVALALHHAPGVYAVLLGSGVSRGAGVPTCWEVTLELIRRLAVADEGEAPESPEEWYRDRYEADPDYSDVLERWESPLMFNAMPSHVTALWPRTRRRAALESCNSALTCDICMARVWESNLRCELGNLRE